MGRLRRLWALAIFSFFALSAEAEIEVTHSAFEGSGPNQRAVIAGKVFAGEETSGKRSLKFFLPDKWASLITETPDLGAGGELFFFDCFSIPQNTPCGSYPIMAAIEEDGILVSETFFIIEVPKFEDFRISLQAPSVAACGEPFEAELLIENYGNNTLPYHILINETEGWRLHEAEELEGVASPGEKVRKKAWITSLVLEEHPRVLSVFLFEKDLGRLIARKEAIVDVVMKGGRHVSMKRRLPATAQFSAMGTENRFAVAAALWSKGRLSSESCRWYDLFLRLPTDSRNVLYQQYQTFYLHLSDPKQSLTLGDAIYDLSFLTEHCALRRGAEARRRIGKAELRGFYWQQAPPFSCGIKEWGGSAGLDLSRRAAVSWNLLNKNAEGCPGRTVQSLVLSYFSREAFIEIEGAYDHAAGKALQESGACHIKAEGSGNKYWWNLEKSYAGRYFGGYLNDLDLNAVSGEVSIAPCVRLLAGGGVLSEHLRLCPEDEERVFLKQQNFQAGINIRTKKCGALTLQGFILRSKDDSPLPGFNFLQHWLNGAFFLGRGLTQWAFNASCGNEYDYINDRTHKNLQRYGIYCSRSIGRSSFQLLFETGNTNYYDAKRWKNSYGLTGSWRLTSASCLGFLVRRSENFYKRKALNHLSFWYRCKSRRGERWHADFRYFDRTVFGKGRRIEFLASYSVPFQVLAGRRKDRGALYGILREEENGAALPNALVSLGSEKVLTDEEGRFWFEGLCPGTYSFNVQGLRDKLISDRRSITISGGKDAFAETSAFTPASISVSVYIYEEEGTYEQWESKLMEGKPPSCTRIVKGGEQFPLLLRKGFHRRAEKTDFKGECLIADVAPGEWEIFLPSLGFYAETHSLKEKSVRLEVQNGGCYEVNFYLVPN